RMEKQEKMLIFNFRLNGSVTVPCDRCNDPVTIPVEGQEDLIIKFGSDFLEESEVVQIIPEGVTQFDVAPYLYEYIHLAMPVRRIHPEGEDGSSQCDPEVIKRLEGNEAPSEPDPRWEALKKLKSNN
ncbi:MAG: YceD family protein, partial [Syntrophothermus sp.]